MALTAETDDDGNVEVIDPKTGALIVFTPEQLKDGAPSVSTGAVQAPQPMRDVETLTFLEKARDASRAHARDAGLLQG